LPSQSLHALWAIDGLLTARVARTQSSSAANANPDHHILQCPYPCIGTSSAPPSPMAPHTADCADAGRNQPLHSTLETTAMEPVGGGKVSASVVAKGRTLDVKRMCPSDTPQWFASRARLHRHCVPDSMHRAPVDTQNTKQNIPSAPAATVPTRWHNTSRTHHFTTPRQSQLHA
jgi:hypothetical protein